MVQTDVENNSTGAPLKAKIPSATPNEIKDAVGKKEGGKHPEINIVSSANTVRDSGSPAASSPASGKSTNDGSLHHLESDEEPDRQAEDRDSIAKAENELVAGKEAIKGLEDVLSNITKSAKGFEDAVVGAKQERDHERKVFEGHKQRHNATCKNVVRRMLQIQLAAAFDRYVEAVQQKVEKKNMCMQVIGRLMHRNLSISWDLYCEAVDRSREEKEIAAEKQRIEAEHDREQKRLDAEKKKAEEDANKTKEELEAERKAREQDKKKLAEEKKELAQAKEEAKQEAEKSKEELETERAEREAERLKLKQEQRALERAIQEVKHTLEEEEQSHSQTRARNEEERVELAQAKDNVEALVKSAKERHTEMCRNVVRRMLHVQLASAFDRFAEAVANKVEKKEMCKLVVHRMMHRQLAMAWETFGLALDRQREADEAEAEKTRLQEEAAAERERLAREKGEIEGKLKGTKSELEMTQAEKEEAMRLKEKEREARKGTEKALDKYKKGLEDREDKVRRMEREKAERESNMATLIKALEKELKENKEKGRRLDRRLSQTSDTSSLPRSSGSFRSPPSGGGGERGSGDRMHSPKERHQKGFMVASRSSARAEELEKLERSKHQVDPWKDAQGGEVVRLYKGGRWVSVVVPMNLRPNLHRNAVSEY